MASDQQDINRRFFVLAIIILFINLLFFLLNLAIHERQISKIFPKKYSSVLMENNSMKSSLYMDKKIQSLQRDIIEQQQQYLEFYFALFIRRSMQEIERMEKQKVDFDKELEEMQDRIENLLASENNETNDIGLGGE